MRQVLNLQLQLSEVEISQIEIDLRSRDETPKLLHGLQYIYSMPDTRREVFQILEGMVPQQIDPHNGRPGLDLWKVLVLGALRLNSNWNYDKLQDIANNHKTLRQMLGQLADFQHNSLHLRALRTSYDGFDNL